MNILQAWPAAELSLQKELLQVEAKLALHRPVLHHNAGQAVQAIQAVQAAQAGQAARGAGPSAAANSAGAAQGPLCVWVAARSMNRVGVLVAVQEDASDW